MTFITNETEETSVKIRPGDSVLSAAARSKIPLDASCLEGTCGSCRVTVVTASRELEPPGEVEAMTLEERGFLPEERLGCQMNACAGLKVKVPVYD